MAATTEAPPAPSLSSGTTIRVGTRRSALALKQCEIVIAALSQTHPHINFETVTVSVMGDRDKTTPLPNLGKGLWTSELEAMLTASPPELDHDLDSSEDESMPPSPPIAVLPTFTEKQRESSAEEEKDQEAFYDQGFYLPPRNPARLVSAISVY